METIPKERADSTERTLSFSPEAGKEIEEIVRRYPKRQAALLPLLWLAQREFGFIDRPALELVAETLGLTPAFVLGTYSFYTMFRNETTGRHHIQVCRNLACWLRGYEEILERIEKRLGIAPGQTTPDSRYTLSVVECLGSCGTAPMMQIDDTFHENLTCERVEAIFDELDRGFDEWDGSVGRTGGDA